MITINVCGLVAGTACQNHPTQIRRLGGHTYFLFLDCDTTGVEVDWEEIGPDLCNKGVYMPLRPVFTDPRWY